LIKGCRAKFLNLTPCRRCNVFIVFALAEKKELTAEEAAGVSQLWRKLVKLFHLDRFAHEPEMQETSHKLTAAINDAKDHGDLATLRRIAEDPHGFIPRQAGPRSTSAGSAKERNPEVT
jgi:hypothetical protein